MNNEIKICQMIGPMQVDRAKISSHLFTIIVDGGTNHQLIFNRYLSIGDGDSSHTPDLIQHKYNTDKDETDFELALQYIPNESEELHLHGFLGGRIDHFLSVLGNAQRHLNNSRLKKIIFYDQESMIYMFNKKMQIIHHGTFSLLSFIDQRTSIHGSVKYQANEIFIQALSGLTISNQAAGEINIECEQIAFLICHSPQVK
jgi:thiamine pyrophosphokinase